MFIFEQIMVEINSCRICLTNEADKLSDLFSAPNNQKYIAKISFCCGIQISENDDLPHKICNICLASVQAACAIKEKCIETDKFLRQQLKISSDAIVVKNEKVEDMNDDVDEPTQELSNNHRSYGRLKTFKTLTNKKQHRKSNKLSDFRCFICEETFDMIKTKNEHIITMHAGTDRCKVCDRVCKTSIACERHMKTHFVKDNIFLCPVCARTFFKKYSLERHLIQLHGDSAPQFYCDLCDGWKTKFRTNLKRHMKTVHLNIKQHRCPYVETCPNKLFTTKDTLNFHLIGHHNLILIKCSNCSQKFDTDQDLEQHKTSGRCIQRTITKRNRGHKLTANDDASTELTCQFCHKTFSNRTQLSVHYHQKHKSSLNCKVCNKEFTQYANLLRHIKTIHEHQKRFTCRTCSKSFSQKHSLQNHLNIHTGDKPFACGGCPFKTGDRSTLAKHKKKKCFAE